MRIATVTLIAAAVVVIPVALSQVSTGTINVQVQDSTGAVVPGAVVNLTHVGTGQTRQGVTHEDGLFRGAFLPLGEYTVAAVAAGFKKKIISGLDLRLDQNTTITAVLEPGEVREVVQVTGITPLLESNTSSIGQVIENTKILELPLNGRNAFSLGLLAGNTTPVTGQGTNLPFIGGGGRFSSNEVMLDGVDDNTTANPSGGIGRAGIAYTPSVDAVQEFKVQTNNVSAEFGNSAGVVINATTRAGTNKLHGSLFEFLRNDKLDANNFFANATSRPRAPFRQNQFGGSVGGPVLHNRTFFFADYEGTRQRTAATSTISDVPPAGFRTGDFSGYSTPIYDAAARRIGPNGAVISDPYPGNRIPASQLNPTSAAIMRLVPLPNYGDPRAQSRNYFLQVPTRFNYDRWDTRIDHSLRPNNTLFGRFSFGNQVTPTPSRFGVGQWVGGGTSTVNFSRQLVLSDTHLFRPSVVNEFRFGYIRYNGSIQGAAVKGVSFAGQNNLALFPFPVQGFPSILFPYSGQEQGAAQFSALGGGNPYYQFENRFQWADNLNITRGTHTFKMGADIRRLRLDMLMGTPFFGEYLFGSTFTSSSNASGSGSPFADFLLGFPTAIGGTQELDWNREREIYAGEYFQDDWKVGRNFTLNLGVRYDLYTQPVDARNRGSMFNIKTGVFQLPGQNGYSRSIVNGDHNNIAPRAGFAWQARPKLVVRGGFGLFYGMRDRNQQTTAFGNDPPNIPQFSSPASSPTTTVTPPYTLNTPIAVGPSDPTLSGYTITHQYPGNVRSTSFQNANFPYLEQANVSVQYQPAGAWLFELNLTGARGKDLTSGAFNRNSLPFSAALSGQNTQAARPFPNITGWMIESGSWGSSSYQAINFKVEKRFSAGLSFLANYTISKNFENLGVGVCNFSQYATIIMLDSYSPQREKVLSALDIPQVFVMNYVYELPWGPGRPWLTRGALSRVLGGWQVNGITTLRGGIPGEVLTNVQPPVFSNFNVPDRVSGVPMYLGKGPDGYLNPAAFRVPGAVVNQLGTPVQMYGNSARGVVRGPGSVNLDFSVFKEFGIKERFKAQFRSEFFNLTNTPTFFLGAPATSPMTCTGSPGGPCTNSSFGTLASGTATGRQIQFGLKLLF